MRTMRSLAVGLLMVGAMSSQVHAHANYASSTPSANATLRTPPKTVSVVVSQQVEASFSRIEVTDAKGVRVDNKRTRVTDGRTRLVVDLQPLPAGTYTVRWYAASVDTHRTSGSFKFKVAP